ncbi:unnamed protein product [Cuscuta europaea]|uniref:Splicing factor YJU2 n=1 Tax=Cuscuta europaea TaxID=41803 RepID=A0A9P0YJR9_CUSEU|nr:unnamed protein product [Cuscuta europaea]
MGERKVLNKYYPPDFDPAKIPRRRQPKNQQMKVRMMLPMSVRCSTCGNYIYKGTKFNSRKEDAVGETYLGIQIFRFYFKCTKCSAEIAYKTDPKNSDYVVESGATRNFEPWRDQDEVLDKEKQKREAEEMGDAMKSLENRTLDSKREMDILAALDEMKSMKSRHATVSVDAMLEALRDSTEEKERKTEEEEEALIKYLFKGEREKFIKRIHDEDIEDEDEDDEDIDVVEHKGGESSINFLKRKQPEEITSNPTDVFAKSNATDGKDKAVRKGDSGNETIIFKSSSVKVAIVKKKQQPSEPTSLKSNALASLCQEYESDEDD